MKILITGATGFIGNAIAHRLVEQGHSLRCLVRKDSDTRQLADIVWEKAVGDITSIEDCREATRGMEAVIHTAAFVTDFGHWKTFRKVNVQGSLNLAEASLGNKVGRFVYLSTSDVLGVVTDRVIDDTMDYKRTGFPYPDTKIEAEQELFDLYRKRSLPLVAFRPAWVYGPGDRTFFPEVVDAMANGTMIYFGSKKNFLYLNYIDNLVDAILCGLEQDKAIGRAYLVTDDVPITWEDLCCRLADGVGCSSPKITIPYGLSYAAAFGLESVWGLVRAKSRPLLTRYAVTLMGSNMRYDITRLKQELGYRPSISPEVGLERTIEWLKTQPLGKISHK